MVDTQAAPGCRWWSGRKSDQGLAGCVSGPVHNQDHTMKHTGQLPAHQVRALPRRFCPGFGRIGGKRLRCKPILGALLSWVVQEPPGRRNHQRPLTWWPGNGHTWPGRGNLVHQADQSRIASAMNNIAGCC